MTGSVTHQSIPPGAHPSHRQVAGHDHSRAAGTQRQGEPAEGQDVAELQARDRQVRAHEASHKAAAGRYGGVVSYEYVAGPDGRRYAVGGEVAIDASPVPGDPQATIRKMEMVARAALAPAQPSAQDRAVAAKARQLAASAQREVMLEQRKERSEPDNEPARGDSPNLAGNGFPRTSGTVLDVVV